MSGSNLRPVTAFVTTRKEQVPPISALMHDFRMHPSERERPAQPTLPPKPRRKPQRPGSYLVPQYIPTYSASSAVQEKTSGRKSVTGISGPTTVATTPVRSLLTTAFGSRVSRSGSTTAIQHNREVIYNLHAQGEQAVKDVNWQREIRKSPFSAHAYDWKRSDETLTKKTISTGNLRLFLEEGTEVKNGHALVKVCYNYCRSCSRRMTAIQVKLQS